MMGEFDPKGPDAIYAPFHLTSDNNTLVVSEGGGTKANVNLETGRYWNTLAPSTNMPDGSSGNEGLLTEIENELTGTLSGSYSVFSETPQNSHLLNSGIRILRTDSTNQFELHFEDSNWTLDPRLIGFSGQENLSSADQSFNSGDELTSRFSIWAKLQTYSLVDGKASMKRRVPRQRVETASSDVSRGSAQKLNKFNIRKLKYEYVPGALVKENRADDEGSAGNVQVPWFDSTDFSPDGGGSTEVYGDTHNSFEMLWDMMTTPGLDSKLSRLIFVHDRGDAGHSLNYPMEFVRFRGPEAGMNDPSELYDMQVAKGELYSIEFETQIFDAVSYDQ